MEIRNKYSKRSIGKKTISIIRTNGESHSECCIFEGFFDMLTYASIRKWMMDIQLCVENDCDYIVLNSISNIKTAFPYLQVYDVVHCYLDNDAAGIATTKKIMDEYSKKVIDESVRYRNFKDLNDVINGIVKK